MVNVPVQVASTRLKASVQAPVPRQGWSWRSGWFVLPCFAVFIYVAIWGRGRKEATGAVVVGSSPVLREQLRAALESNDVEAAMRLRGKVGVAAAAEQEQLADERETAAGKAPPAQAAQLLESASQARHRSILLDRRRRAEEREDFAAARNLTAELVAAGWRDDVQVWPSGVRPSEEQVREARRDFEMVLQTTAIPRARDCKICKKCVLAADAPTRAPGSPPPSAPPDGVCEQCLCTHLLTQLTPGKATAKTTTGPGAKTVLLNLDPGATQSAVFIARGAGGWNGILKLRPRFRWGPLAPTGPTAVESVRLQRVVQDCGVQDLFAGEWLEEIETALPWPTLRTDKRFWNWLEENLTGTALPLGEHPLQAEVRGVSVRMYLDQVLRNRKDSSTLDFLTGQNKSAMLRLAVFDLLTAQADRHQEHLYVAPSGDTSHPITIDSSPTAFDYKRLSSLMLPGTFYHERGHIGQFFGSERTRSFKNSHMWLFDYRCFLPKHKTELATDYPPDIAKCLRKYAKADIAGLALHLNLTDSQANFLVTRAQSMLSEGFEPTLRAAGRYAFPAMYGRRFYPDGIPPELWPTSFCCHLKTARGQCADGPNPGIPEGYPPSPGEPGAVEYWKRFGHNVTEAPLPWRARVPPVGAPGPVRPGGPVPPPSTLEDADVWVWITHTCEGNRPCQDPSPIQILVVGFKPTMCAGSGHSMCTGGLPSTTITWGR
eukprot:Hpha_TRINITY_DN680_c0_g1::TRINITY_DN680_c0_g1_i1::g.21242::m.21242